ncbi:hypothetical protein PAMA_014483 [Pampus argenteus]
MSKAGDYSSQSTRPDSSAKSKEKDDMVGLNDKFIRMIDKMKKQEEEKQKLTTKLKILKEQEAYEGKLGTELEKKKLETDDTKNKSAAGLVQSFSYMSAMSLLAQMNLYFHFRYETEMQRRIDQETEFILFKEEVDKHQLDAVEQALELEDLVGKLDFRRLAYDEEIRELQSYVQNETVTLHDSSKRLLDMDEIIQSVKNQYAKMATNTRAEAELWNQKKMDVMVSKARQREQEARDLKRELSDMLRLIQKLNGDLLVLTNKQPEENHHAGGGLEAGQAGFGWNDLRIPRPDEPQAGPGHRDRHLPQAAGGRRAANERLHAQSRFLKTKQTIHLHADVHLLLKKHLPERRPSPEPTHVTPATTDIPAPTHIPNGKKRLLIRVEVEEGRVVSESCHYTED